MSRTVSVVGDDLAVVADDEVLFGPTSITICRADLVDLDPELATKEA